VTINVIEIGMTCEEGGACRVEKPSCIFAGNLGLVLGPLPPSGTPVTRNNVNGFMVEGIFVQNNYA